MPTLLLLKHVGVLLVVLLTVLSLLPLVVSENPNNTCLSSNIVFYAYGETTCPHCKKLHDFFDTTFKHNYVFCYIDKYSECYSNLGKFILDIVKLPGAQSVQSVLGYIPQTYILKNNTYLLGIVIGAVTDETFWLNLTCREPTSEIPVYEGTTQVGVIEANTTLQSELAQKILSYIPPVETQGIPGELVLGVIRPSLLNIRSSIIIKTKFMFLNSFSKTSKLNNIRAARKRRNNKSHK